MARLLAISALALTLSAVSGIASAADFEFYRTVKHSDQLMLEGRSVNDLRDMHPVDVGGAKLGEIDGVLINDAGERSDQNKVAAIILDVKDKIAKHKKVLIAVEDVRFDPTNRKQIVINKTQDQLRAMTPWDSD